MTPAPFFNEDLTWIPLWNTLQPSDIAIANQNEHCYLCARTPRNQTFFNKCIILGFLALILPSVFWLGNGLWAPTLFFLGALASSQLVLSSIQLRIDRNHDTIQKRTKLWCGIHWKSTYRFAGKVRFESCSFKSDDQRFVTLTAIGTSGGRMELLDFSLGSKTVSEIACLINLLEFNKEKLAQQT